MLLLVSFLMFFFLSETLSKVGMVLKTFPFIVWSSALKPSLRLLNFHNFECNFTYPVSLNFHCLFFFQALQRVTVASGSLAKQQLHLRVSISGLPGFPPFDFSQPAEPQMKLRGFGEKYLTPLPLTLPTSVHASNFLPLDCMEKGVLY